VVKTVDPALTATASVTALPDATEVTGAPVAVIDKAVAVLAAPFLTVTTRVVPANVPPEEPAMDSVDVPGGAELLTVSVSKLVPVAGFVPNIAVTPLGRPATDRLTLPVNPYVGFTVIVDVYELPGVTISTPGDAER
jgi:hypothetical protein